MFQKYSQTWWVPVIVAVSTVQCHGSDTTLAWPQRNGPTMNGHVSAAHAEGIPLKFSEADSNNIRWKVPLKDFGHSTPVIGDGRVWLTAATEDGAKQYIYCLDAETGEVLHHKLLVENAEPEPLNNKINTYASPSCVLRDDAVYVHFGTYGTFRLNPVTAEVVWQRKDIHCRHFRGPGSSPVLFDDLLLLTFDGIDVQFVTALNTTTGKTVWRTDRSTDYGDLDDDGKPKGDGDFRKAYGTPGLVEVDGRTQLISIGSRAGFGYDALTGEELWTFRHDDYNAAAPPSFLGNHAIVNTGSRGANLLSIELTETTRGDISDTHVRWDRPKGNSRLASPLLVDKRIYMISDSGVVNCVNAEDGDQVWKGRVGGTHVASPIAVNQRLYFFSEEGEVAVIAAADKFKVLARNKLQEGGRASPAAAHGRLYLRSFGHLYCVGQ